VGNKKYMTKVAVLIPDRGDRPEFLKNCMRMLASQTILAKHIELVNYPPTSDQKDITQRYRIGYDSLRNKGFDLIVFIENDDWYAPYYLETMITQWEKSGKPIILGTGYTIYYHIKLKAWYKMEHVHRASAMNTLIVPDLDLTWPVDNEPYTDIHLWEELFHKQGKGVVFTPEKIISIGIKHGVGACGGRSHVDGFARYVNKDDDFSYIKEHMDQQSFEFYTQYFNQ
jgi:hypothetical protein